MILRKKELIITAYYCNMLSTLFYIVLKYLYLCVIKQREATKSLNLLDNFKYLKQKT